MECVFCGKIIPVRYEEHTPYYECECEDAKKEREITEKIRHLNRERPIPKFRYDRILVPIED
jgi:hypothetical protein